MEQPSPVAPQRLVDAVRRFTGYLRSHVAIGVERDADLRMSQDLHDHSGRHTLGEQDAGGGVPEIMDADLPKVSLADQLAERPVVVAGMNGRPVPGGEDESGVRPRVGIPALHSLALLVLVQSFKHRMG